MSEERRSRVWRRALDEYDYWPWRLTCGVCGEQTWCRTHKRAIEYLEEHVREEHNSERNNDCDA